MQGFKSFADNIELTFSDGITAIVGPNGSGKSNISDAVRWVLGEQSAKTLRGAKMEDVIFNGTQTRKRLGFAEVSLYLDNKDRHFNANYDEIVVTRKVFASGEGQYFMNNVPCRLKDIHEIFMDTGLGRDGYSMIGQGKIDEILSGKAEDRRQIFEEASGISKFRYRKEEAERKLRHTDENLDRVADIIGELEAQLGPLAQQAEKAKKYLTLYNELKIYDVNLALRIVERSRTQGLVYVEKLTAVLAQLEEAEKLLTETDLEQEQCYAHFEKLDIATAQAEESLQNTNNSIVIYQREIEVLKNTIEGNLRLLERIEKETEDLFSEKLMAEKGIQDEEQKIAAFNEKLAGIKKEKTALASSLDDMGEDANRESGRIEEIKQGISKAFDIVSDCKIKLSNIAFLEQNLQKRCRELSHELTEKQKDLEAQKDRGTSLDKEFNRKTEFVDGIEKQLAEQRKQEETLQNLLTEKQKNISELQLNKNQKMTRLHLLTEMEQNFEGYYKSVKEIMKQHDGGMLRNAGIYGPVSKLIHVEQAYAVAIGAAIGGALQNIVVKTEEDAKKAIAYLKKQGAGRATFMPVSAVSGSLIDVSKIKNEPGYLGIASELVSYDDCYDGVIKNLLGKTIVIEKVDEAIAISRKYKQSIRIVTLDGEVFYPGGSIAGGSQQKGSQLLGREQEIRKLKDELKSCEQTIVNLEKKKKALEAKILDLAQEQVQTENVYRENKEVLLLLTRDRDHHGLLLSALEDAIVNIKQSIIDAQAEGQQFMAEKEQVEEQLKEAEASIQTNRVILNELEQIQESFANDRQKINDQIMEKGFEESAVMRDIDQCKEKMETLFHEISQADMHITLRHQEKKEILSSNETHHQDIITKEEQTNTLSKEIEAIRQSMAVFSTERQSVEQKLRDLQGNSKNNHETIYDLKTEIGRLETQKEKLETEAEAAISRLWDEYEIVFSEAAKLHKDDLGTDHAIAKQISILRSKIRELGNVNVDAIEEEKAVTERYNFLTNQRDDLQKAKRDLLRLIEEMQTIMKRQFKEKFDKINKHFKTTFSELFGGGNADLKLSDEDHILESGIDINVQPPGKKLQSLSLLSGGERALSAIALLFAILRIKPTPFCFLDEIEAALDENNVYRYAEFIKRFSRHTQFILVTHRRGTMECADVIYGVTMQEKGVSKLLPLHLEEIDA